MKITVIALGKLKESYLRAAVDEYSKRLSRFCELRITELNPAPLPDDPSAAQTENALRCEAEAIQKVIPKQAFVVSMCIEGKELSSREFAEKITQATELHSNICFIIGSSYGLSDEIKRLSDLRLSVSRMTFPHQLFRVMLLEQIYRAFMINENSKYHK